MSLHVNMAEPEINLEASGATIPTLIDEVAGGYAIHASHGVYHPLVSKK